MKGAHLGAGQRPAGAHALDRLFKHALGEAAFDHLGRRCRLDAASISGVLVLDFVGQLLAVALPLVRFDDDDMISSFAIRGIARLLLSSPYFCHYLTHPPLPPYPNTLVFF